MQRRWFHNSKVFSMANSPNSETSRQHSRPYLTEEEQQSLLALVESQGWQVFLREAHLNLSPYQRDLKASKDMAEVYRAQGAVTYAEGTLSLPQQLLNRGGK
jgi:hypothetical protein